MKIIDKVVLVINKEVPVSVGVGSNCFPIVDDQITEDNAQRLGATVANKLKHYEDAYNLAIWAWQNQMFDSVEKH